MEARTPLAECENFYHHEKKRTIFLRLTPVAAEKIIGFSTKFTILHERVNPARVVLVQRQVLKLLEVKV
jgi:hypothetical protein